MGENGELPQTPQSTMTFPSGILAAPEMYVCVGEYRTSGNKGCEQTGE